MGNAAEIGEQLRRIDAQAFEVGAASAQDRDERRPDTLGDRADSVPAHKFSRETTRNTHMPGFVAVYATQDSGHSWFHPQNPAGRDERGKDLADRGINGRDRGKVRAKTGLRNTVEETDQGVAQLLVWSGRGQGTAQPPQQHFMHALLARNTRQRMAGRVIER